MDINAALQQLRAAGATVEAYIDIGGREWPNHGPRVFITKGDEGAYAANPDAYLARHFKVNEVTYRLWVEAQGDVRCAAMTKAKKRCKCLVTGLGGLHDPADWAEREAMGAYCSIHGGEGARP